MLLISSRFWLYLIQVFLNQLLRAGVLNEQLFIYAQNGKYWLVQPIERVHDFLKASIWILLW